MLSVLWLSNRYRLHCLMKPMYFDSFAFLPHWVLFLFSPHHNNIHPLPSLRIWNSNKAASHPIPFIPLSLPLAFSLSLSLSLSLFLRDYASVGLNIAAVIYQSQSPPRYRVAARQVVSVLIVGWSYGARNVLSYTRRMMQHFLPFRDSPIIPLRRSPRIRRTQHAPRLKESAAFLGLHPAGPPCVSPRSSCFQSRPSPKEREIMGLCIPECKYEERIARPARRGRAHWHAQPSCCCSSFYTCNPFSNIMLGDLFDNLSI